MKSSFYIFCISLLLLSFAAQGKAQEQGKVSVGLKSGVTVIFTSKTEPAGSVRMAVGSIELAGGNNIIHRAFVDVERGMYFGYDVVVESNDEARGYKLTFKPLSTKPSKVARQIATGQIILKQGTVVSGIGGNSSSGGQQKTVQLAPLNALELPEYPEPQFVQKGDTLALDVLVNRQTGVKIIDLIKVANIEDPQFMSVRDKLASRYGRGGNINQAFTPGENQQPADLTVDAIELKVTASQLLINGKFASSEKSSSGYGVTGPLIWFYIPNHGRFILSLTPRDGYDFQKTGTIQGNKINFTFGGNQYDWVSSSPILPIGSRPWNLWVLHDPDYRPDVTFTREFPIEVGAVERVEYLIKKK